MAPGGGSLSLSHRSSLTDPMIDGEPDAPEDSSANLERMHASDIPSSTAAPMPADLVQEWAQRGVWTGGATLGIATLMQLGGVAITAAAALLVVSLLVLRIAEPVAEDGEGSARGWLENRTRDFWENEGASAYGVVTLVRFIQLEIATLWDEFSQAGSLADFLREESMEMIIRFSFRSLMNSIDAALWPIDVITRWGFVGIVGLMVGYAAWDRFHDWVDDRLGQR